MDIHHVLHFSARCLKPNQTYATITALLFSLPPSLRWAVLRKESSLVYRKRKDPNHSTESFSIRAFHFHWSTPCRRYMLHWLIRGLTRVSCLAQCENMLWRFAGKQKSERAIQYSNESPSCFHPSFNTMRRSTLLPELGARHCRR